MAFKPGLRRESLGVSPDYAFLASEHYATIRSGVTFDSSIPGADADGNKILMAGTVVGKVTATGKYGAYDNGAIDGRETAVGFLMEEINLKDGDVTAPIMTHGSVIVARTSGLDAAARTDLAGRFFFVE